MNTSINRGKPYKVLIISFLIIGFLFAVGIFPLFMNSSTLCQTEKADSFDKSVEFLKISDVGEGSTLNTTIHQSKVEQGNPLHTITNASNPTNNTFSTICPDDKEFKTTQQEIKIENIYAPNKSITYEDESGFSSSLNALLDSRLAASFDIKGSGYLKDISVYLKNIDNTINGSLTVKIFNATWDSINGLNKPGSQYGADLKTGVKVLNNYDDWYTFSNLDLYLDTLQTENNTFFLVLNDTNDDTNWAYIRDTEGPDPKDDSDDLDCFRENNQDSWIIFRDSSHPSKDKVDFFLKCDFYPISNTPNATDITLAINNITTADFDEGKEYGAILRCLRPFQIRLISQYRQTGGMSHAILLRLL